MRNTKAALEIDLRANKGIGLLVAAVLLFAGSVVIFYSASTYDRGKRSLLWLTVRGDLASIEWYGEISGNGAAFPMVQYRYEFEGKHYAGSNTCFGAASEATCRLAGRQPGQKVSGFVNPDKPQESVLLPGPSGFAQGCLAVGGILLLLGLIIGGSAVNSRAPKN